MNLGNKSIAFEITAIVTLAFMAMACAATAGGWILSYVRFV